MLTRHLHSKRVLATAAISLALATPALAQPEEGDLAPDFTVKLFDGSKKTLEDYRGQVVVINYWATWCGPCKAEMPMMDAFHRKHKQRGFEILGVVTKDSVPKYKLKAVEKALSYPLASSLKGKYGLISDGVPTSYIIDRKGRIAFAKAGSFSGAEFNQIILPLLEEKP